MQRKYTIFTGGFLQPHSYLSLLDKSKFLALGLWFDLYLFLLIAWLWFWFARVFRRNVISTSFSYFFTVSFIVSILLFINFKVFSYFSDSLDFFVIKNLGGGSVANALSYVADETIILYGMALPACIAYFYGRNWVRRKFADVDVPVLPDIFSLSKAFFFLIPLTLITVLLVLVVNDDEQLRHGLRKKLAFVTVAKGLDVLSDFDRDRYGLFFFPTDLDPFNSSIYPSAVDIPHNGIDEDGIGGDFVYAENNHDPFDDLVPQNGKHIILFVLESARYDVIGKTLNGRHVAPNITALAKRYTRLHYAYSHTGYTTSSLIALFNRTLLPGDTRKTLVDYLLQSGYQLSFLSGQDESFGNMAQTIGMTGPGRYFFDAASAYEDRVFPSKDPGSLRLSEARLVDQLKARFKKIDWQTPQFIYLNFQAAHFPYSHPTMPKLLTKSFIPRSAIAIENRAWVQATYWNALAVADQAIGEVVQLLKAHQLFDDTLLVITGDHGESLFDDGFLGHGHYLDSVQTRIPLILTATGFTFPEPIGQLDMAEIIIRAATPQKPMDSRRAKESRAVFQFVGSIATPAQIGIVESDEKRTVFNLNNRTVFFSDLDTWQPYRMIAKKDNDLRRRVYRLIKTWEILRWKQYQLNHSS